MVGMILMKPMNHLFDINTYYVLFINTAVEARGFLITFTAGEVKKSGGSPMRCYAHSDETFSAHFRFFQAWKENADIKWWEAKLGFWSFWDSEPKFVTFEDFRHHLWIDEGFRVVLESWRSSHTLRLVGEQSHTTHFRAAILKMDTVGNGDLAPFLFWISCYVFLWMIPSLTLFLSDYCDLLVPKTTFSGKASSRDKSPFAADICCSTTHSWQHPIILLGKNHGKTMSVKK